MSGLRCTDSKDWRHFLQVEHWYSFVVVPIDCNLGYMGMATHHLPLYWSKEQDLYRFHHLHLRNLHHLHLFPLELNHHFARFLLSSLIGLFSLLSVDHLKGLEYPWVCPQRQLGTKIERDTWILGIHTYSMSVMLGQLVTDMRKSSGRFHWSSKVGQLDLLLFLLP